MYSFHCFFRNLVFITTVISFLTGIVVQQSCFDILWWIFIREILYVCVACSSLLFLPKVLVFLTATTTTNDSDNCGKRTQISTECSQSKNSNPFHRGGEMRGTTQYNLKDIHNICFIIVKKYICFYRCQKYRPQKSVLLEKKACD